MGVYFMRKIFLICALTVALLVTPVTASNSLIWINGYPTDIDVVWKDDHIYVPIRYVAENLGCEVTWGPDVWGFNRVDIKSIIVRPEISGEAEFVNMINQALDLLEDKDPAHYCMICQNATSIWVQPSLKGDDGFYVFARTLGRTIAFSPDFCEDEKRFVPEYVAGILAHEGAHVCYYRAENNFDDLVKNENISYSHGLIALDLVGAPFWMIKETQNSKDYVLKHN